MLYNPEQEVDTVLRLAANEIRQRGWTRHTQLDLKTGAVCLHGAINIARGEYPPGISSQEYDRKPEMRFKRYLQAVHGVYDDKRSYGSAEWNNADERTAEEVIAALEGAAGWRE